MAKYLVTGAAGFIGRSIAAALLKREVPVRGIDSLITGKRSNLAGLEAMEFIEGELTDPQLMFARLQRRRNRVPRGRTGLGAALSRRPGGYESAFA